MGLILNIETKKWLCAHAKSRGIFIKNRIFHAIAFNFQRYFISTFECVHTHTQQCGGKNVS